MTKEELQRFTDLAKKLKDECGKSDCRMCPFYIIDDKRFGHNCKLSDMPYLWIFGEDKKEPYELKIGKVYTLDGFRKKFLKGNFDEEPLDYARHREFRIFLDNNGYFDIWDYPMSELDYIIEERKKVVPVTDGKEIRFYEIEMED
jgi:hypothetical protein